MEVDVLSEKAKKLKHVKVYNRLYSMPASLRTGAGTADGRKPHDPAQGSGAAAGG